MELSAKIRRLRSALLVALFGLGTYSSVAAAADIAVTLDGDHEVPAVMSRASGTGTISVADDGTVTGSIMTTGVEGTMAHIHTGAEGVNGPPIVTLAKANDTYTVPSGTKLTEAQMESLENEELYVNVHSAAYPNGEIRGQLEN
jgi:hypothetical protein